VQELGADVNGVTDDGPTPISVAICNEDLRLVRYLVRMLGTDVNKADSSGTTPLIIAAQNGQL
jgi:ankyrin repeat protein